MTQSDEAAAAIAPITVRGLSLPARPMLTRPTEHGHEASVGDLRLAAYPRAGFAGFGSPGWLGSAALVWEDEHFGTGAAFGSTPEIAIEAAWQMHDRRMDYVETRVIRAQVERDPHPEPAPFELPDAAPIVGHIPGYRSGVYTETQYGRADDDKSPEGVSHFR